MIQTATSNMYRLEITDYEQDSVVSYVMGGGTEISLLVPPDAVVSVTDFSGRMLEIRCSFLDGEDSPLAPLPAKRVSFDPGYEITMTGNWGGLTEFGDACANTPCSLILIVPEAGAAGGTGWTQLDLFANGVFSTNETRRKTIPPPPPADPLQDQSMDIPLAADGSYRLIALGDRKAWPGENGSPQSDAWIAKDSPERQRVSAVVQVTDTSAYDAMAWAMPTHLQAELLDATGQTPSRVALLGSMADGDESRIQASPFEHELPLPQAVAGLASGFSWIPYGTCLGGQCEVWRDDAASTVSAMFAFVLSLSPLMENAILPLVENARRPAIRFRYADDLSSGWPAWRGWSTSIRFTVNSLPPVPQDLSMTGVNADA